MKAFRYLPLLAIAACASAATPQTQSPGFSLESVQLVDLTHPFDEHTLYWPTDEQGFELQTLHHGPGDGGYFYSAYRFASAEHGGTHVDAPIHFAEGRSTTEAIPLDRLIAPAIVIDMREAAEGDADALLQPQDILDDEVRHGAIDPDVIVLVRTGWSERWSDRKLYFGDDTPGTTANLHFPGISREAAQLLVARKVAAVGIDTASLDHGPSSEFWAHRVLLDAEIPGFENVTDLAVLPPRGFFVAALPMKISGGSGGPLRIVAMVPR